MNQIEIENSILEIMNECEMFTESSPLTYLVFLERYSHLLNEIQIKNVQDVIDNLKTRIHIINNLNLKKFICEEKKS